jgi:HTH-type transcriptional regulator / antitoxin HipB
MTVRSIRDLAAAVHGRRADLGLSQAELASRAGVSRKWIYEFEAGKSTAGIGTLLRVFDALGLALDVAPRDDAHPRAGRGTVDLDALIDEHRNR